jgi:signal transduction histidine kinase
MDILGQSALFVSLTSFALGFSVLSRNVKNTLFISFAILTTLICAWSLAFFLEKIWDGIGFYRLHLVFNVLLAPASLWFTRIFIRISDRFSRRLLDFSVVLAIFLSASLGLRLESNPWILQIVYFSPALVIFQVLRLMWVDWILSLPQGKSVRDLSKVPTVGLERRSLIYVGALIVLFCSLMDHLPQVGKILPSVGNLLLAVYLFFLSQAITQQRLLNVSALFSRFLVLLVVALTLTLLYTLLVAWIENSPSLFFLNSFIASFLLLMLLEPLRNTVGYFTQRLLTKKHRQLQQTLREAQRKLTGIVDFAALTHEILASTEQMLRPEWAALFVLRSDGTKFRRIRLVGQEPQPEVLAGGGRPVFKEVLSNHALVQYCEDLAKKGKFPVIFDQLLENEMDRSASRVQRAHYLALIEGLKALGSNLLIPLFHSGKILGFVTLQVMAPPEPWGSNWGLLPIIYPFFEQAAEVMSNLEVYARQREKERLAALGEMAAGLAHEIRNPLGAIKGAAQFLDPSQDRPESKFLTVIVEEVDRLNRVVSQFLDYSKPAVAHFSAFDLGELVEKTLAMMRPGLRDAVKIELLQHRSPILVMGAAEQVQQVLINLIQNSQNALLDVSEGVIRVSLLTHRDLSHPEVSLVVEDNGRGIKKENLDKLFIPFFTTSPSGTGLGLSISHKIIESHRGRFEVVSEEGRFTRISVILPWLSSAQAK